MAVGLDWRAMDRRAWARPPFFRLASGGGQPGVVTSLNLRLHGIRSDRASGRGSAIIGLPYGSQASYAVGNEIVPGAVLGAVALDSVTIRRGGGNEAAARSDHHAADRAR